MSKLYYPAVFHKADGDEAGFWVEFPDLPGCITEGDTIKEAYMMAKDALGVYLDNDDKQPYIQPSMIETIQKVYPGELVMLIEFDSLEYARMYKTKSVKKTLSIPEWLNEEALEKGINFSQVLQEALITKLRSL